MENNINQEIITDENKGITVIDINSPEIQELLNNTDEDNNKIEQIINTDIIQKEEISIDDKLKRLEELEQKMTRMEWKQKYNLDDDAMSIVKSEEDAAKLQKLLKKQNSFKPSETRKEVIPISKAEFKKMNYNQRAQLYKQNPELYTTLSK